MFPPDLTECLNITQICPFLAPLPDLHLNPWSSEDTHTQLAFEPVLSPVKTLGLHGLASPRSLLCATAESPVLTRSPRPPMLGCNRFLARLLSGPRAIPRIPQHCLSICVSKLWCSSNPAFAVSVAWCGLHFILLPCPRTGHWKVRL